MRSGLTPVLSETRDRRPSAAGNHLGKSVDRHAVDRNPAPPGERGELRVAYADGDLHLVRQPLDVHACDVVAVHLDRQRHAVSTQGAFPSRRPH